MQLPPMAPLQDEVRQFAPLRSATSVTPRREPAPCPGTARRTVLIQVSEATVERILNAWSPVLQHVGAPPRNDLG